MRARVFSGDRCVGSVSVLGLRDEEWSEEERAELRCISEGRSSGLRQAILERDMIPKEGRVLQHRKRNVLDVIEGAAVGSRGRGCECLRVANDSDYSMQIRTTKMF